MQRIFVFLETKPIYLGTKRRECAVQNVLISKCCYCSNNVARRQLKIFIKFFPYMCLHRYVVK